MLLTTSVSSVNSSIPDWFYTAQHTYLSLIVYAHIRHLKHSKDFVIFSLYILKWASIREMLKLSIILIYKLFTSQLAAS